MIGLLVGGSAAGILNGCNPFSATRSYRYRLTVVGEHTGSAVYEVLASHSQFVLLSQEKLGGSGIKGDALVLETPLGLIFLIPGKASNRSEDMIGLVTHTLASDIPMGGHDNFWRAVGRLGSVFGAAKAELPRAYWPMMVRFRDLTDPTSIEQVDPEAIGASRIIVETTDDNVTTGIEKRFPPWFLAVLKKGARFNGNTSIAVSISGGLAEEYGPDLLSSRF
ncbi:hypothetical protein O6Y00_00295 [Sphingomonas faeni]